jgi:ABC-type multidrug transport system ATPase subunit
VSDDVEIRLHSREPVETIRLRTPALLYEGRRLPLRNGRLVAGRDPGADLVLNGTDDIAPLQFELRHSGGETTIVSAAAGTLLNGEAVEEGEHVLQTGDAITAGRHTSRFLTGHEVDLPRLDAPEDEPDAEVTLRRVRVGSDPGNEIVLSHAMVSAHHAEVVRTPAGIELRDLGTSTGTRINGQHVERCLLVTGSEVGIGPFRLVFDGATLVPFERGGLRLESRGVTVDAGQKRILQPTVFAVDPGQLVAVIGESGAGKSTLLRALAGIERPTFGMATLSGEDVTVRTLDVGYVPQDDIVHGALTVVEALRFAAHLRLPADADEARIEARVAEVIAELGLMPHAHTRIDLLSGGQRKRVGVATELLSDPPVLCLDEPTSALDPHLQRRMMKLLRRLADGSRTVVLVTHATRDLDMCDRIAVLASGGVLVFHGTPAEARSFFGVSDLGDLHPALEQRPAAEWQARFEQQPERVAAAGALLSSPLTAGANAPPRRHPLAQAAVLTHRYAKLLVRDRRNLTILLAQVPVLAIAIALLFQLDVLTDVRQSNQAGQLLFMLVTTSVWLGSILAAREIVKESAIAAREAAVGVRLSAYLTSKLVLLLGLATGQAIGLALLVLLLRPSGESPSALASLVAILVLSAWVAVLTGLIVSSLVSTQDQASSFVPLLLIPQLLYGGALVPIASMNPLLQWLSYGAIARWGYDGSASAFDLDVRIAADPVFSRVSRYGEDFASAAPGVYMLGLLALALAHLAILTLVVHRRLFDH